MDIAKLTPDEIRELHAKGEHLAPQDGRKPTFANEEEATVYLHRTLGLTARGVAALSAMAANGGVPSKPSKSKRNGDLAWRIVIVGALTYLVLRGSSVHVGTDGIDVTPSQHRTAVQP